jgi:hypothetical protein
MIRYTLCTLITDGDGERKNCFAICSGLVLGLCNAVFIFAFLNFSKHQRCCNKERYNSVAKQTSAPTRLTNNFFLAASKCGEGFKN